MKFRRLITFFLAFILLFATSCAISLPKDNKEEAPENIVEESDILEKGYYYDVQDVAKYVHLYGKLPENYITKSEAEKIGWSVKDRGDFVIGGDKFGNREGLLPEEKGRQYYEADISAGYSNNRGPLRIVYSNDGLIFYTENHYETFEQLY